MCKLELHGSFTGIVLRVSVNLRFVCRLISSVVDRSQLFLQKALVRRAVAFRHACVACCGALGGFKAL